MKKSYEEQIKEIIKYFDFERVRKAMIALSWKYFDEEEYPSMGTLILTANKLLGDVSKYKDNDYYIASTGGFRAENNLGRLRLSFEVCDWEIEEENEDD